jgi:hypothetical protein
MPSRLTTSTANTVNNLQSPSTAIAGRNRTRDRRQFLCPLQRQLDLSRERLLGILDEVPDDYDPLVLRCDAKSAGDACFGAPGDRPATANGATARQPQARLGRTDRQTYA